MKIVEPEPCVELKHRPVTYADVPIGGVYRHIGLYPRVKQPDGKNIGLKQNCGPSLVLLAGSELEDTQVEYFPEAKVVLGPAQTTMPVDGKLTLPK